MGEVSVQAVTQVMVQGPVEKEVKEWIKMGRGTRSKIGVPGKEFDLSNMATLINYLTCLGLVTDIEKKQLSDLLNKK